MLTQFIPLITTVLSKEENMHFIAGLVLGVLLGGAGAFIYFTVRKPKA